jgi:hypothetical protein
MPRDTPPAEKQVRPPPPKPAFRNPTPEPIRPPPREREKSPSPPPPAKQGPSSSIEEAFLRAGATVIEAAPVLRDFQKEATTFVPSALKRRPPPKKPKEVKEGPKIEQTKSFATTVEDVDEAETGDARVGETIVAEKSPERGEAPLKRPLEEEKVEQPPLVQPSAPVSVPATKAPPAAPPKRRRLVNAAPDV